MDKLKHGKLSEQGSFAIASSTLSILRLLIEDSSWKSAQDLMTSVRQEGRGLISRCGQTSVSSIGTYILPSFNFFVVLIDEWFEFPLNLALKKMMGASYYKTGQGSSNPTLPSSRNHPGITHRFLLPISSNLSCLLVGSTIIFFKAKLRGNSTHYSSRNHPGSTHG